ncbi:MAG TPA: response regulator [Thermoanaerobaculia bacterium]|nr:response regulator [Thermoanaerobaculia bacterium]
MLVVDDERVIRFALKSYFGEHGLAVDCAAERDEALELIARTNYDIVIADLRLSGTTSEEGLDVIRAARQQSRDTRVILLTAYRTSAVDERAKDLGVDMLLHKPKPLAQLAQAVFSLLAS